MQNKRGILIQQGYLRQLSVQEFSLMLFNAFSDLLFI